MSINYKPLQDALESICLSDAFLASIILQHSIAEDAATSTMSTDGKTLRYSKDFVAAQSFDALKGLLKHEALHVALMHHVRRGDRDAKRWNRAADYAINLSLTDEGQKLPDGGLLDERFRNQDSESIYRQLDAEQDEAPKDGNGDDVPQPGEVLDAPGDKEAAEADAKVMVQQAITMAKRMGKLSGGMERQVRSALEPRIPWREVLARFVSETSRNDYTLAKPNKRFLQSGFVMPSLYSREIGDIWLAVDTSRSVSDSEVAAMVTELLGVLSMQCEQGTRPMVHVIYCDAKVHSIQVIEDEHDTPLPKGGGGTDFAPVFARLLQDDVTPRALVYLTDGQCDSFGDAPAYPVLWGLIRRNDTFAPPFGETFKAY